MATQWVQKIDRGRSRSSSHICHILELIVASSVKKFSLPLDYQSDRQMDREVQGSDRLVLFFLCVQVASGAARHQVCDKHDEGEQEEPAGTTAASPL